jgi:ATP-dependent DNA helicase RecG
MKRIFISSVQKEFQEERLGLREYLQADPLLKQFFDVFLFEDLPAADRRADDVYLTEVADCDLYMGLLGNEYGWEDHNGLSPTEREFNVASELGKTRLVYVKGTTDKDKHSKMQGLIGRAGNELIRRRFNDLSTLKTAVYASLVDYLVEHQLISVGPWDAAPCLKAMQEDLDADAMVAFIRQARYARNFPLAESTPPAELLSHLDLLDAGRPTNAAVMLFGKRPQSFFPTSEIKCAHFHGTEVAKPIPSYQSYKGTVFQLVDQAIDFVMSKIAARVGTRSQSSQAPVTYEIPRDVVAEGIVNAVVHRDYASNASVQVMLFADRLEISNPGRLPDSLTFESLRHSHASVPRNPLIAEPMYLTQYIERMGTGTGDMIRLCREAGLPEPIFSYRDGFVLTIPRLGFEKARDSESGSGKSSGKSSGKMSGKMSGKAEGKTVGRAGQRIIRLIQKNPQITIPEMALSLGVTERAVEKQIRNLREQEIIGRIGPANGGHWEVLE